MKQFFLELAIYTTVAVAFLVLCLMLVIWVMA
jgi:hypothetical protein